MADDDGRPAVDAVDCVADGVDSVVVVPAVADELDVQVEVAAWPSQSEPPLLDPGLKALDCVLDGDASEAGC